MYSKLQLLASGIIEENDNLPISEPREIVKQIVGEEVYKDSFVIKGTLGKNIRGFLYSENPALILKESQFEGEEVIVHYEVLPKSLTIVGELRTNIVVETDGGCLTIPCHFIKEETDTANYEGMPKSLEELADMAKEWPVGARMIFSLPEFPHQEFMKDKQLYYEALKQETPQPYFLEEFLVAMNAKQPTLFHLEQDKIEISIKEKDLIGEVTVLLEDWGVAEIEILCSDEFIEVEKNILKESDFSDGKASFQYSLNREKMHGGNNFGKIYLISPYCRCEYSVTAFVAFDEGTVSRKNYRSALCNFTVSHIHFLEGIFVHSKEQHLQMLIEEMKTSLQMIRKEAPQALQYLLMDACICAKEGRKKEALDLLKPVKSAITIDREKKPFHYALYLLAMSYLEETVDVNEFLMQELQKEEGYKSLLFLLAIQTNEAFRQNTEEVYRLAKRLYNTESKSRYFIVIGARCILQNPTIFHQVEEFETCALKYLLEKKWLTKEIAKASCVGNNAGKHFRWVLFDVYQKIYEQFPLNEILRNICELFIRADCQERKYFCWYEKGVKADIRITRLYDYYMYSLPEDFCEKFPKNLVLYYSYDRPVDVEICKKLYCNVARFYRHDATVFARYESLIKNYAYEHMKLEHLDPESVPIYEFVYDGEGLEKEEAQKLYTLLFTHKITCKRPDITSFVYVTYGKQVVVPLRKGIAYLPIFESEYVLVFRDTHNRQLTHIEYIDEFVYENPTLKEKCELLIPEHPAVMDRYLMQIVTKKSYTREDITLFEQYVNDRKMNKDLRKQLLKGCIAYYLQHTDGSCDITTLMEAKSLLVGKEVVDFIHLLILHHYYSEAFQLIKENGCEQLEVQLVFKLCRCLLELSKASYDSSLVSMVYWLFEKGYSDTYLLSYLSIYYQGSIKNMTRIVKECHKEGITCASMTKLLLQKMLFAQVYEEMDEIYNDYKEGDNEELLLTSAYLVLKCHRYVIGVTAFTPKLYQDIMSLGIEYPDSIKLALLRFYTEKEELSDDEKHLMAELLLEVQKKKIRLLFLEKAAIRLGKSGTMLLESDVCKEEKVWVKYQIDGGKVHYEEMEKSYGGIFVKDIVLFADETVKFEILDQVKEVRCPSYMQYGTNRYAMMNQMAGNKNDRSSFVEYEKLRRMVNNHYQLL